MPRSRPSSCQPTGVGRFLASRLYPLSIPQFHLGFRNRLRRSRSSTATSCFESVPAAAAGDLVDGFHLLLQRAVNLRGCAFEGLWRDLEAAGGWNFRQKLHGFGSTATVRMMVESGSTAEAGAVVNRPSEKDHVEEGGYASGGWKSEDGRLSCGYSSFRGKRATMEDFYGATSSEVNGQTVCLFGIFDGHGGSRAAEYLKEHLFDSLLRHPQFMANTKLAISESYQKTDADFLDAERHTFRDDGSTASTAILVGNRLYVGNVGDSRVVVSKAGKAIPLSDDHKPNRSDERQRIEDAGGVVMWAGTWRVGGVLAMSRAFGNRLLKQFVVAEPEIQEQEVNDELELLILASDGLWDVVSNEDAVSLARMEDAPGSAARKLTETAYSRGSADNITCIVVRFHHEKSTPGDSPSEGPQD